MKKPSLRGRSRMSLGETRYVSSTVFEDSSVEKCPVVRVVCDTVVVVPKSAAAAPGDSPLCWRNMKNLSAVLESISYVDLEIFIMSLIDCVAKVIVTSADLDRENISCMIGSALEYEVNSSNVIYTFRSMSIFCVSRPAIRFLMSIAATDTSACDRDGIDIASANMRTHAPFYMLL